MRIGLKFSAPLITVFACLPALATTSQGTPDVYRGNDQAPDPAGEPEGPLSVRDTMSRLANDQGRRAVTMPLARIQNRIENRIDNRISNRIDSNFEPAVEAMSPLADSLARQRTVSPEL